ncbi:MAG: GlsB/YeaQ/YmgE family stress response membrane protein [Candidatus Competibacteraceae bacterium]
MTNIIYYLIIGGIAGWLAGQITQGSGFGLPVNIVIGIVGAILGGVIFSILGLSAHNIIGSLITATIGAVALLFIIPLFKK